MRSITEFKSDPLALAVYVDCRMTAQRPKALKTWPAEPGLTLTEGFHEGMALLRGLRDRFGPEPVEDLLELIDAADGFQIDKEREIRVERRGDDVWAVREMGSVVNRSRGREHEPTPSSRDEDCIARTRFGLQEALRIARARAVNEQIDGKGK